MCKRGVARLQARYSTRSAAQGPRFLIVPSTPARAGDFQRRRNTIVTRATLKALQLHVHVRLLGIRVIADGVVYLAVACCCWLSSPARAVARPTACSELDERGALRLPDIQQVSPFHTLSLSERRPRTYVPLAG